MEGRELRRLRQAHGLSREELATMTKATLDELQDWEAGTTPISAETRHVVLRELALWRDRREERSPARPRAIPVGFVPARLLATAVRQDY